MFRRLRRASGLGAGILALVATMALIPTPAVAAVTFTVNSTADAVDVAVGDGLCATSAGTCTLRAAVQETNDLPGADNIIVPAGTYELALPPLNENLADSGDLDVIGSVTVTGAGVGATIIDGGEPFTGAPVEQLSLDRLFEIHPTANNVTISGVTLREGWHQEAGGAVHNSSHGSVTFRGVEVLDSFATTSGGGIYHGEPIDFNCVEPCIGGTGSLELVDSTVSGNTTGGEGGGLFVMFGTLQITGGTITDNQGRNGGGLYNAGQLSETGFPSRAVITGTTISGNTALAGGAGIFSEHEGALSLTDATVTENAAFDYGGGVAVTSKASLTVTRGIFSANEAVGDGGGVYADAERSVTISGATFSDNVAGATMTDELGLPVEGGGGGGGLAAGGSGAITVTNATFATNLSTGAGGGILINNNGSVRIVDSAVRDNRTQAAGGGIQNEGMRVTVERATITDNRAALDGGGVHSEGSGDFTLKDSSLFRNTAENGGGFANAADGATRVVGTTVWDNRAVVGINDDSGLGGGIYGLGDAQAQYENVTISGNLAQVRGGGFYTDSDAAVSIVNGTITGNLAPTASGVGGELNVVNFPIMPSTSVLFRNTIVAGNLHSQACNFALGSEGGNLEDGDSCFFRGTRDRTHASSPGLDAIADNGGPTLTHALQEGSFALDGGVTPCPPTDQRGVTRPQGALCDIGAFEFEGPFPAPDTTPPDTAVVDGPLSTGEVATFVFSGTDDVTPPADLLFECRFINTDPTEPPEPPDPTAPPDPELVFLGCPNPYQVTAIAEGFNALEVRAIDRAGNVDPTPAVHHFVGGEDFAPPETFFTLTPPNPSAGRTAIFGFAGTDDVTPPVLLEYECRIDSFDPEAWLECTSPTSFTNLTTGQHRVEVRAIDEAGIADPTPATYIWTVASPTDCAEANVTVPAEADSWIDEGNTEENFGADISLTVRSAEGGEDARTLVLFEVPTGLPAECELLSARLRLYSEGAPGRTLEAVPIAGPWGENTVTWLNQPTTSGTPATATSGTGHREWDVTAQVTAMLDGSLTNNGWLIQDSVEEDPQGEEQSFSSRNTPIEPDAPPEVPQLVLRFDVPDAPPPPPPPAPTPRTGELRPGAHREHPRAQRPVRLPAGRPGHRCREHPR